MYLQLLIIIAILLIALFSGTPVMAAIGCTACIAMMAFMEGNYWEQFAHIAYSKTMSSDFLIAPLFLMMSEFLANGNIAEDIFALLHRVMKKIKGGLAMATTLTCTIFAALCGSSPATAASIGVIATDAMTKRKYRKDFAIGTVAGGGTLGILIPPSMTLVGYGILTETSISKLLMAGLIPGLLMAGLMILTIIIRCRINPGLVGEFPKEKLLAGKYDANAYSVDLTKGLDNDDSPAQKLSTQLKLVLPSLALIVVVLGSLYSGAATATESAAIGALGALLLVFAQKRLTKDIFLKSMRGIARTGTMMIFLMVAGFSLSLVLTMLGIPTALATAIANSGLSKYVVLALVYILWFVLGCLMDPGSMVILTIPFLFTTLTEGLGFDPIWLGVTSTIMTSIGMITPPVGLNLFVLKATSKVEFKFILKGVWPYVFVLMVGLVLITIFPETALVIPNRM